MRESIGDIGHVFVLVSFVTSIVGCISYFLSSSNELESDKTSWLYFGRAIFATHVLSVIGVIFSLFFIIYNHYYEYHYAWDHSSNDLPVYYMISCFWEGQEGSFLLWIFWHTVIGSIFFFSKSKWESEVFTVIMSVQVFLTSMIVGTAFGDFRIGSSPFIMLSDVMQNAPIYAQNPNYIPDDGTGLNALLQNYWMVIHPPTLFLGFALTIIPFALAVASLWKKDFTSWMKPALPWLVINAAILGTGIMMGAYWAYETLNFGGYWNWDPVENAVYIPWLFIVAAIHTMLLFNKHKTVLKTTYFLVIASFVLVVYASFLTRSGILGDTSVHSFTDLGLTFQLASFLITYFIFGIFIYQFRKKEIPGSTNEIKSNNIEFWILFAVIILGLTAFQVWFGTSIPVINKVLGSNIAPPTNQIKFYSQFQIWGGIALAVVGGMGQFLYWQRRDEETLKALSKKFFLIVLVLVVCSTILIVWYSSTSGYFELAVQKIQDTSGQNSSLFRLALSIFSYILLLAFSLFSLLSAGSIIKNLFKADSKSKIGGAITHSGIALMLIGILFSSGYDKIVSINRTGFRISQNASEEFNAENIGLKRHRTVAMGKYALTYQGRRRESRDIDRYIKFEEFYRGKDINHAVAREDIKVDGKTVVAIGDTFDISPDNFYYEITYRDPDGDEFTLHPRAQINPQMGGLLASPDVKSLITKDLYTHVSSVVDPNDEKTWSDTTFKTLALKDTFFINDFVASFDTVERVENLPWFEFDKEAIVLQATISVMSPRGERFHIKPLLYLRHGDVTNPIPLSDESEDVGARVFFAFSGDFKEGMPLFKVGFSTTPLDYVVLKVVEKPLINLLWLGTLVAIIGFMISFFRRYKELKSA